MESDSVLQVPDPDPLPCKCSGGDVKITCWSRLSVKVDFGPRGDVGISRCRQKRECREKGRPDLCPVHKSKE